MFEGIATGNVVNEERTRRTAIVRAGDGTEGFLAGCVPDLKLNVIIILTMLGCYCCVCVCACGIVCNRIH